MKAIRGRVGQYKILQQQKFLHPYLVPIERFTRDSLFFMLERYNDIILKPIVGMDFITVSKEQEAFCVTVNELPVVVLDKEAVYETIQQEVAKRNYIIQPQINYTRFCKKTAHRLITVQKNGANWQVVTTTKILNHLYEAFVYEGCRAKLQKIALVAAETLGEYYPYCELIVIEVACDLRGEVFIYDSFLHFSVSKWNQYQSISRFMPTTDLLTRATFQSFLERYPVVFLKPCNGQQGKGIIKISKLDATSYEIHTGRTKWVKENILKVYEHIHDIFPITNNYIIQQGIPLATIDHCVIDFRVMLQKVDGVWQVTGKAVKIAGDLFFITNAAKAIFSLEEAFKHSTIPSVFHKQLGGKIDSTCLATVKELDYQKERTIIGFDVGVTNTGGIWIIEGNYVPDISIFTKLENQTMYNTIMKNRRVVKQPNEQS